MTASQCFHGLLLACAMLPGWIDASERDDAPVPPRSVTRDVPEDADVVGVAPFTTSNCNSCPNAFHRAGHPECVSRWAVSSNNNRYGGYYIGGGLPVRGEAPCLYHDGTWGWDYFGILFTKRIVLNWGHGLRHQGGSGVYKTDGPKLRHE